MRMYNEKATLNNLEETIGKIYQDISTYQRWMEGTMRTVKILQIQYDNLIEARKERCIKKSRPVKLPKCACGGI